MESHQLEYFAQGIAVAIDQGIKAGFENQPTLRDQFAMAALQGALAGDSVGALSADGASCFAYEIADAMLEARKPKQAAQ